MRQAPSPPPQDPPLPEELRLSKRPDGEEFVILPPLVEARLAQFPLTSDFWFIGGGYYPRAGMLRRDRPQGSREHTLIYCSGGHAWVQVNGKRHSLTAGQFVLLPPHVPHGYGPDETDPWSIHWLSFGGVKATEYVRQLPDRQFILPVADAHRQDVARLFTQLHNLLRENLSDSHLICASKMAECLLGILLLRNRALHTSDGHTVDPVAAAVRIMQDRLYQTVTLDELAQAAHFSKPHFVRLFRRRMGVSPMNYFIQLKMQRACQYLDTTDRPVKVIAQHLGYVDVCYFTRVFKKVMHETPNAHRRSRGGKETAE